MGEIIVHFHVKDGQLKSKINQKDANPIDTAVARTAIDALSQMFLNQYLKSSKINVDKPDK